MKRLFALFLIIFTGCTDAYAKAPLAVTASAQYQRLGFDAWGHEHVAHSSVTINNFVGDDGDLVTDAVGDLHLFEFGTRIEVSCATLNTTMCWVMDANETTMTTAGVITDTDNTSNSGNDGIGDCFRVVAGTPPVEHALSRDPFRSLTQPGRRQAYCANSGWPCDADADCPNSETCTATSNDAIAPFDKIRGAFLLTRTSSVATCFITEKR